MLVFIYLFIIILYSHNKVLICALDVVGDSSSSSNRPINSISNGTSFTHKNGMTGMVVARGLKSQDHASRFILIYKIKLSLR